MGETAMFCYQCEQTAKGVACTTGGVCGKSPETSALQDLLGARVNVANPLDYHLYIWGDYEQLNACFAKFLSNKFACTLLVLDYPPHAGADQSNWQITEQALIDAVEDGGEMVAMTIICTLSAAIAKTTR